MTDRQAQPILWLHESSLVYSLPLRCSDDTLLLQQVVMDQTDRRLGAQLHTTKFLTVFVDSLKDVVMMLDSTQQRLDKIYHHRLIEGDIRVTPLILK
jgi:hypothetical protein